MESLLQQIRKLRKQKGWTQADLSEKLNTTQSNYTFIETGKTELTIGKLEKLAKIFEVSVIELLGGDAVDSVEIGKLQNEIKDLKKENESLKEEKKILKSSIDNQEFKIKNYEQEIKELRQNLGNALEGIDICFNSLIAVNYKIYSKYEKGIINFSEFSDDFWKYLFENSMSVCYILENFLVSDSFMYQKYLLFCKDKDAFFKKLIDGKKINLLHLD